MTPEQICSTFWFAPDDIAPLGSGHINDSYRVSHQGRRFVLQRVNEGVFVRPEEVMANTETLVAHLTRSSVPTPQLIPTVTGASYARVQSGVWRVWTFVDGRVFDALPDARTAEVAGRAYAAFQQAAKNLAVDPWPDPIEGFMQLSTYLAAFDEVRSDAVDSELIRCIDEHRELADMFSTRDRFVHADCKLSNIIFDAAGEVAALIDFDTAMWGHWAWDFGDLARSACARDGHFDCTLFAALLRGFLTYETHGSAEAFAKAPRYVGCMLVVRYLTDHLRGDRDFKVSEPGENLRRAHARMQVVNSMVVQEGRMLEIAKRETDRP